MSEQCTNCGLFTAHPLEFTAKAFLHFHHLMSRLRRWTGKGWDTSAQDAGQNADEAGQPSNSNALLANTLKGNQKLFSKKVTLICG